MKRLLFTALITLALAAAAGCHGKQQPKQIPSPTSGSVKPEIDAGLEVATVPPPAAVAASDDACTESHRKALEHADDTETWMEFAQGCFDGSNYPQAEKAIAQATKLDPSSPAPWKLLTRVLQSKEMWKESIDASEEAIARGSDSPWTFNNLGYACLVLGRSDDAIRELEKAVSFDTGVTPAIWNNLGLAYEKKGELASAASAYRSALAGNPGYVKAKVNLSRLTVVAKAQGIAIGVRKAEAGPMPVSSPTPSELEDRGIGESSGSSN